MLNYGRSVSADHVSNYKFMVLLQLFIIKDRLLDTLDAKISPEMICDTTDQVYQSLSEHVDEMFDFASLC